MLPKFGFKFLFILGMTMFGLTLLLRLSSSSSESYPETAAKYSAQSDSKFNADFGKRGHRPARNCREIQRAIFTGHSIHQYQDLGTKSSRQVISSLDSLKKKVLCDFETDGGGWTIIQQRMAGAPHYLFNRGLEDYEQGFGVEDSYWLGLKAIREITEDVEQTLRIELTDGTGETRWAEYKEFEVGHSKFFYRLRVSRYSGNAGDSLSYHNGQGFSTFDHDNYDHDEGNCARSQHSGWWFKGSNCAESNLNGLFRDDKSGQHESTDIGDGITWNGWKGPNYSLKKVQMKIRPSNFSPHNDL